MSGASNKLDMEAVFRSYRERIHRHVLHLVRDAELARDLTQETFLRAHRQLAALEDADALAVWLYRIATRLCVDAHRRASRDPHAFCARVNERCAGASDAETAEPNAISLQLAFEQAEMGACVRRVMDALPESYRAVLVLHELHGMTARELADDLGCSVPTVKIRLHRARRRLEAALRERCQLARDDRGVLVCEPIGARQDK